MIAPTIATVALCLVAPAHHAADSEHRAAVRSAQTEARQAAEQHAHARTQAAERRAEERAERSAREQRKPVRRASGGLHGWITEALRIMRQHGIPGSYAGIRRNVLRESGGNPRAVNDWDINAQNGTPSKGLLQTIEPTFRAYHVAGTSWDVFDPVANIVAACNYAAANYGSIDNVNGAY